MVLCQFYSAAAFKTNEKRKEIQPQTSNVSYSLAITLSNGASFGGFSYFISGWREAIAMVKDLSQSKLSILFPSILGDYLQCLTVSFSVFYTPRQTERMVQKKQSERSRFFGLFPDTWELWYW